MSINAFGNSAPTTPQQAKRRNLTPLLVAGIVLAVIVLGAGCATLLFKSGSKAVGGAKVAADQFLSSIEKRDYVAAQKMLSAETRKETTAEDIADVIAILQKRRGRPTSHSGPEGFDIRSLNGVTRVSLVYQERFEKGKTENARLVLVQENDKWKVFSFNFSL